RCIDCTQKLFVLNFALGAILYKELLQIRSCKVSFDHFRGGREFRLLVASCKAGEFLAMVAPWQETQFRVVVEFKKANNGAHREIILTHNAQILPPQLLGRISPEVWAVFITDLSQLAHNHPYKELPSVAYCCDWIANFLCCLVIGFGCFRDANGDYGPWLAQLEAVLQRHRAAFAAGGATLSIGHVHGSYWAQVDVNPQVMAVGAPVAVYYGGAAPYNAGLAPPKMPCSA
ncbi:hypothetical protein Vafri_9501, partial [Volvox africanus]